MYPPAQVNNYLDSSSPREISHAAVRLYAGASSINRCLARFRPYICPFHRLLNLLPQNSSLLDAGCGIGLFSLLAVDGGYVKRAIGIDQSPSAIRTAVQASESLRSQRNGIDIRFCEKNIFDDFDDLDTIDAVSMIDVMHHLGAERGLDIVRRVAGLLPADGTFIYKDISAQSLICSTMNRFHDLALSRQWIQYVPSDSVRAVAESHGLTVVHSERVRQWWYDHEIIAFRKTRR